MFYAVVLFASIALCHSHVLPLVAPAHHDIIVTTAHLHGHAEHGHGGYHYGGHDHGYGEHGYGYEGHYGHGLQGVHHLFKRSPYTVSTIAHEAPIAHISPVAVSHQSRVDVHSAPLVATPVVTPLLHTVPLLHKSYVGGPSNYAAGYYGGGHYDAGHFGVGQLVAGHFRHGYY